MTRYRLRPATPADSNVLLALHRAAMGASVEAVYGPWDDAQQRGFHDRWFATHDISVIEIDGKPAGMLCVDERDGSVHIGRLTLAPEHQGQGLGTDVLHHILASADQEGRTVALEVFEINRARRLYERLGFRVVSRDGPKLCMIRDPVALEPSGTSSNTGST